MKNKRKLKPRMVLYRRKLEQKTDYKKRLKLLTSGKARLVVRFTNQRIIAQLVSFDAKGDKIIIGTDSFALRRLGWNFSCKNYPSAYLTGLLFGKEAISKGQKEAVLDTGLKSPLPKGKIFAFLKGVLDAGLRIPYGEEVLPADEMVGGKQIHDYALILKENQQLYEQKFSQYLKNKSPPEKITESFEQIKQKIS